MECDFLDRAKIIKTCNIVWTGHKGNFYGYPKFKLKMNCDLKPDETPRDDCPQFKVCIEALESRLYLEKGA